MPNKDQDKLQRVQIVSEKQSIEYSGPLPPASELARYEQIFPGFAKEILEMAKAAQRHAHETDSQILTNQTQFAHQHLRYFGRGQVIGGILAMTAIIGGAVISFWGGGMAGAALTGTVIGPLMIAFGWGKWMDRSPSNRKGPGGEN